MDKIRYNTTTGQIKENGPMLNSIAESGEEIKDYDGSSLTGNYHRDSKVDIGALPTISIINKTAQELTDFDNNTSQATGDDIQSRYATKTTADDRIDFLKDLIKLQTNGSATKTAVAAL